MPSFEKGINIQIIVPLPFDLGCAWLLFPNNTQCVVVDVPVNELRFEMRDGEKSTERIRAKPGPMRISGILADVHMERFLEWNEDAAAGRNNDRPIVF